MESMRIICPNGHLGFAPTREESFRLGDIVFREGEVGDKLYIILDGKVRISRDVPGMGEEALAVLGPGAVFGEMALLDEAPRSADARVHERCRLLALPKDAFEDLKRVDPHLVLTHTRTDLHQDHRLACELTWNTFRDHLILEYEVPKWDADLGRPGLYVPLEEDVAEQKLDLLLRHFPSQSGKHWYDTDTFRGLMRLRGLECAAPSRYAEAFNAPKLVMAP